MVHDKHQHLWFQSLWQSLVELLQFENKMFFSSAEKLECHGHLPRGVLCWNCSNWFSGEISLKIREQNLVPWRREEISVPCRHQCRVIWRNYKEQMKWAGGCLLMEITQDRHSLSPASPCQGFPFQKLLCDLITLLGTTEKFKNRELKYIIF